MLRKDILKSRRPGDTADPAEVARFEALADEWWNPAGAFRTVHAFNAARVAWLSEALPPLFDRRQDSARPLDGLRLLDVGCGAGLVCEPMARLGAQVTGIDAAERNVRVATRHAEKAGLAIAYRQALPETLVAEGERFDLVLSLEVVEHVADVEAFLAALAGLTAPGGAVVIGTLNRTARSFALAIVGAEYVLGWLPRGTHDWRRFVRPDDVDRALAAHGLAPVAKQGLVFDPLRWRWRASPDLAVNYLAVYGR